MSPVDVLKRYADAEPLPWANGRGETRELVSFVEADSMFGSPGWRLSVASLREPGPFSALPGLKRVFMPVGGNVALSVGGVERELRAGELLTFDGEADTVLESMSGPCFAINLMSRATSAEVALEAGGISAQNRRRLLAAIALDDMREVRQFDLVRPIRAGEQGVLMPRFAAVTVTDEQR